MNPDGAERQPQNEDETGRVDDEASVDAAAHPDAPIESDDVAQLREALERAEEALAQSRDEVMRTHAEMDNLRKRLARDQENARRFALERMVNDLLPVRDSLERGLEAAEGEATVESLREGKSLILRMLGKVLDDHGVAEIDPAGEPFDPERHEAMSMQPSAEHPENTVVAVLQKGYTLNDRLVRPARVIVSSGPPSV